MMNLTKKHVWTEDPRFCHLSDIIKDAGASKRTLSRYSNALTTQNLAFKPIKGDPTRNVSILSSPYSAGALFCKKEHFSLCVATIAINAGKQEIRQKLANMIGLSSNMDIHPESFKLALERVIKEQQ
jgi:hypothetical protein